MKRILAFFVLAISFAFSFNAFAVVSPDSWVTGGSGDVMTKVADHAVLPATQAHERMCSSMDAWGDRKETDESRPTNDGLSYTDKSFTTVAGGLLYGGIKSSA